MGTDHTLLGTTNAETWAEEFCRIFHGYTIMRDEHTYPVNDRRVDEGTMVGWFANAMETAKNLDHRGREVTAHTNEDRTISLVTDPLPERILISRELLLQMIEQHNASLASGDPFVTYAMADGDLIWGEFDFVTSLDGFDERDEEIRLIKRTYRLISEEEVVLEDPFPIEEEDDDDDEVSETPG